MSKPLKINKFIKTGPVSSLVARAATLADLGIQVERLLPATLQPHCRLLSRHGQTLVLAADSPVWAARLRFHTPRLVKQLARELAESQFTIRVRVIPPVKSTTSPVKHPLGKRRGRLHAASLQQAAQTVSDPRLKSALLKLSRR